MRVWQIMQYLNQSISMILIIMELKSIEIDYLRNGNGIEIKFTWLLSLWMLDLFIQNPNEKWTGLSSDTALGHVHLHVSNINRSKQFYQNMLGLHHTASYPMAIFLLLIIIITM